MHVYYLGNPQQKFSTNPISGSKWDIPHYKLLDALCRVCLLISEFGPLLITAADVAAAALCSIIFDFQDS